MVGTATMLNSFLHESQAEPSNHSADLPVPTKPKPVKVTSDPYERLDMPSEEGYKEPCHRWLLGPAIDNIVRLIESMKTEGLPWFGGFHSSPPLASLPEAEWAKMATVHQRLKSASDHLQRRMLEPDVHDPKLTKADRRLLHKDPGHFFARVPAVDLASLHSASRLLKGISNQHTTVASDYASQRREQLALDFLSDVASGVLTEATRCAQVPQKQKVVSTAAVTTHVPTKLPEPRNL